MDSITQEQNLQNQPLDVPAAILHRRAIKSFILLRQLVELTVAAPSSWNLQDWQIILVQNEDQRKALSEAANGQHQILQAPVTFVFAADSNAWQEDPTPIYQQAIQNGAWTEGTINYFQNAVPSFQMALGEKTASMLLKMP